MSLKFRDTQPAFSATAPDWGDFIRAMIANPDYFAMTSACPNKLYVSRVEAFFTQSSTDWPLLVQLWGLIIQSLPPDAKPSASAIETWNQISINANMPFTLTEQGYLSLNDTRVS